MKNYINLFSILTLMLFAGLGCSMISGESTETPANSNKTLTDKAVDRTVGQTKIGVPECDQVMEAIEADLNNPDDNFAMKAAKAVVLNRFKDSLRESFEQNPNDREALAKTCIEIKSQYDSYKSAEKSGAAN